MGRIFSRRFNLTISGFKKTSSHVRFTSEVKGDVLVLLNFLEQFNGKSLWQMDFICDSDFLLATDRLVLEQYGGAIGVHLLGQNGGLPMISAEI